MFRSAISCIGCCLFVVELLVHPVHGNESADHVLAYRRIPLLTFSDGHNWKTDLGSKYEVRTVHQGKQNSEKPQTKRSIRWDAPSPYLALQIAERATVEAEVQLNVAVFGKSDATRNSIPDELATMVTSVQVNVRSPHAGTQFQLRALANDGEFVCEQNFAATEKWQTFELTVPGTQLHVFQITSDGSESSSGPAAETDWELHVDDVQLVCADAPEFEMPRSADAMLSLTQDRGVRYFIWNYRELEPGRGFILDRNSFQDTISSAAIGYALPAYVIAQREGLLTAAECKRRTRALLRWLTDLDCDQGVGGRFGFPYHFLRPDGTRAGDSEISTVDWAICASGIRVARAVYAEDEQIVSLATELLSRPYWHAAKKSGFISHGFGSDGRLLSSVWGSSFTEEALLVSVEAIAAGGASLDLFARCDRQERHGYWPSWFGAGFTYNWLQLWTGPVEPLATNSTKAFQADIRFCREKFGGTKFGLTACETFSKRDERGFLIWNKYLGESGSDVHLANPHEVKHLALCPYGAALAMPFAKDKAKAALLAYANESSFHPLIGFVDSLRVADLPEGCSEPIPNWTQFAIDVGPMWMAIEAAKPGGGRIAELYRSDPDIQRILTKLLASLDHGISGKIEVPVENDVLGHSMVVQGTSTNLAEDSHLWLAVETQGLLWIKDPEVVSYKDSWIASIIEAEVRSEFSLVLLHVNALGQQRILDWLERGRKTGDYPGLLSIEGSQRLDQVAGLRLR